MRGFETGGFPDRDLSLPFLSFLGVFFFLFLFLCLAYYQHLRGTVPKGFATQSGAFPKKVGKPPGLETLRFSFSQDVKSRGFSAISNHCDCDFAIWASEKFGLKISLNGFWSWGFIFCFYFLSFGCFRDGTHRTPNRWCRAGNEKELMSN